MRKLIVELRSIFEKNNIFSKLEKLNKKVLDPNFWQDKINSKNTVKEKKFFEDLVNSHKETSKRLDDLSELNKLAIEENNQEIQNEILENIKDLHIFVKKK